MCQPKIAAAAPSSSGGSSSSLDGNAMAKRRFLRSEQQRTVYLDWLAFLLPLLAFPLTNVMPIYLTAVVRIISCHAFMTFHYLTADKDDYNIKLSQKQLIRERKDYLVGIILHMWAQLALQVLFPRMFFPCEGSDPFVLYPTLIHASDSVEYISVCAWNTFITHVLLVEPLYYAVHRWLHVPDQMKAMHGHHHMSVNTVPSTSLVQNFTEHFVYIGTFGPAMILPYFATGTQHWLTVALYLVMFDLVNAYGHTNYKCRHWIWESVWSPLRYAFYTPEFHLGHHHYYNCNYGLFMPIWDHLFNTYKVYKKPDVAVLPANQQDFVFLGHNGGLGHLLTIPEISMYNIYDPYWLSGLPLKVEVLAVNAVFSFCRLVMTSYRVSRYPAINRELLETIRREHRMHGTRYFGLGNCNKMKQLNDGGKVISEMVKADKELGQSGVDIRVWTGDTMTAASVYQQLVALPDLQQLFYIGANGKIGTAVCQKLVQRGISVRIFSKYEGFQHPLVSYTQDLNEMHNYKYTLIGKLLKASAYKNVLHLRSSSNGQGSGGDLPTSRYLLDYTVPFMPLSTSKGVSHVQIGVLNVTNSALLRGYYDMCFGLPQGDIYPCHMGCIVNSMDKRETDEIGDVQLDEMDTIWARAISLGLTNRTIDTSV